MTFKQFKEIVVPSLMKKYAESFQKNRYDFGIQQVKCSDIVLDSYNKYVRIYIETTA